MVADMSIEKLKDIRHLFSLIDLELVVRDLDEDGKVCLELEPVKEIDILYKKLSDITVTVPEHIGVYDLVMTSLEDAEHTILHTNEFWWSVLKRDDNSNLQSDDRGRGIIILKNPFCGCKSIEEAQIKADVSGKSALLKFTFVYDTQPSISFKT
jgi:hypothetical protein